MAVLLGVYSNLPWFLAPYYAIATMAGAELTGHHPPPDFREQVGGLFKLSLWQGDFWHRLVVVMKPRLWPYSGRIDPLCCGHRHAAYQLALAFVTNRRLQKIIHRHD